MSPEMMGLLLGLIIGFIDFVVLAFIAKVMVSKAKEHNASDKEMKSVTRFLWGIGLTSIIAFPIIGYFLGPLIFESQLAGAGG